MRKVLIYFLITLFCIDIASAKPPLALSLKEAILLAVRTNPNVQSSQLSYVAQKFNTYVQQWAFYPQYSFQASATLAHTTTTGGQPNIGTRNYNVSPAVSWLTPIGTKMDLTYTGTDSSYYNQGLSLQIMQPLLRGFGMPVVEAALNNAKDSEVISRLNVEGTLRNIITVIINAYLDVVMVEKSVVIDQDALLRAEKSVTQTKQFIQAGHKAGNELVTVQANVASAKAQLINDQNNLIQARYALLTAIGLDPNSDIHFSTLNVDELINKYHFSDLKQAKNLTLKNDIQYQIDQITLHGPASRNLLVAEDNARWQLNLTVNAATNNGVVGDQNNSIVNIFNGSNQAQSAGLTLQIPIDDQLSKQAIMNAKIAIKQAELALLQERWSKETSAINGWNAVMSAKRSLQYAEESEKLQEKTYQVNYQKYLYGLIDSLELQSAQMQLIQAQQMLLSARINYLKGLVNLDFLIGMTLRTWNIKAQLL
jgi:outer membrane protein TolC